MKIGTKANAIDDLGKFDGSKMTIKVDGKQIYPQKRYAIVRVCTDNGIYRCPTNNGKCLYPKGVEVYCKKCAEINGDTKEQLILKIAQVIYKQEVKLWATSFLMQIEEVSEYVREGIYDKSLTLAKEIVEFLGVEE